MSKPYQNVSELTSQANHDATSAAMVGTRLRTTIWSVKLGLTDQTKEVVMVVGMMEAKTHLSKLVEASLRGERVVIANRGKPVVELVPIAQPPDKPVGGVFNWGGGVAGHVDELMAGFGSW
jgi:prevent-host-death family protein